MRREPVFDVLSGVAQTINKIQGLRIDIVGQQNLPRVGGGVLAVNHTSYVDFIGRAGGPPVQAVRALHDEEEPGGALVRRFLMRHCKAIGVDRIAGHESYMKAVDLLRAGELVVVYPEATISRSFELKEFKSGAARMAIEAGVPIIPVVIWGAQRIWTKGMPRRLGRHKIPINIRVGEPIPPRESVGELTAAMRASMSALLEQAQAGYPAPAGEPWVPARLGGGAPDLATAKQIEEAEFAERRARGDHV